MSELVQLNSSTNKTLPQKFDVLYQGARHFHKIAENMCNSCNQTEASLALSREHIISEKPGAPLQNWRARNIYP